MINWATKDEREIKEPMEVSRLGNLQPWIKKEPFKNCHNGAFFENCQQNGGENKFVFGWRWQQQIRKFWRKLARYEKDLNVLFFFFFLSSKVFIGFYYIREEL